MKKKRRLFSLLLCGTLLFSLFTQPAFASPGAQAQDGGIAKSADGLCEHHPRHDADCGYTEGTPGTDCTHRHTKDCYTEITKCIHKHDESCYPKEENSGSEETATPSGAAKREPENCSHICSEESGCITKKLNCRHEHNSQCGYAPETKGTPCGYVCEICGATDAAPSAPEDPGAAAGIQAMADALPVETASGDFGTGTSFHWELADGTLTVTGSGPMPDFALEANRPWHTDKDKIDKVVIEDGVTSVGKYAFTNCSALTAAELPESIGTIGNDAFTNCNNLVLDKLPGQVTSIGERAFYYCKKLALTELPDGITDIGMYAFCGCFELALTELPKGLTVINENAFSNCGKLVLTKLPDGVTSIGSSAFSGCISLALTELPANLTKIGDSAFQQCAKITLTSLPDGVTDIGNFAFDTCKNLALTKLPANITIIKRYTFSNCDSLALTELPDGLTDIWDYAFVNCKKLELTQMPGSVKSIGMSAFAGCTGLTQLTFTQDPAPTLSYGAFSRCDALTIYIPDGAAGYDNNYGTSDKIAHKVTVQAGANGSASASPDLAKQGTEITLDAAPDPGYHLKEWQVGAGGVTVADNTFTMPAGNVAIQAVFEQDVPPAITGQPQDQTVATGQTAAFAVTVTGAPAPTCQWQVSRDENHWEDIPDAEGSSYTIEKADKSMDGWKYRCLAASSLGSAVSEEALLTVHSTDAGIQSVSVDGTEGTVDGTEIAVVLPYGTALPTESSKILIVPAEGAAISALATADGGATWTFTVTAEDGATTESYRITVSNAPNPAAENIADVEDAKATLRNMSWIVEQSAANTETAVKEWLENRLQGMDLNHVTCTVSITGFTPAFAGSSADRAGTDGSFSFTISLSKGEGDTFAADTTAELSGTVTALPYQPREYMVSASASPLAGGTVSGSGMYTENTVATIEAFANEGYHFVNWTEEGSQVSTNASYTFAVTGSRSLTAVFEPDSVPTPPDPPEPPQPVKYSVTVETEGSGAASASLTSAAAGTRITLTAEAGDGYHFKEWQAVSGNVSISQNTFTMPEENVTVKAVFEPDSVPAPPDPPEPPQPPDPPEPPQPPQPSEPPQPPQPVKYSVTVETEGSGTASASLTFAAAGTRITLTAKAGDGYHFKEWQVISGSVSISENTFTMPEENVTVKAVFRENSGGSSSGDSHNFASSRSDRSYRGETAKKGTGALFTDVQETDWFYQDILFIYEKGLIKGNGQTGFSPDSHAARIQLAEMIYRMEGSPRVEGKNNFADVEYGPGSIESYDAVTWAQQNGIISGYENGKFGAGDSVSREQLALILYRYAMYKNYDVSAAGSLEGFIDKDNAAGWAREALIWAVSSGIMEGAGDNLLSPQETLTRAQLAAILHRFMDKYPQNPVTSPGMAGGMAEAQNP